MIGALPGPRTALALPRIRPGAFLMPSLGDLLFVWATVLARTGQD